MDGLSAGREQECREFRASLPADIRQAFVEVSERPGAARGERLQIFYYGRWGTEEFSKVSPVLIINGGPGFSSATTFREMIDQLTRLRVPFVFTDQRGTGCSSPYPDFVEASFERLALYSSSEIVADAEVIRKKEFGEKPWRIFGHSFGARVALRYVATFPDSLTTVVYSGDSVGNPPPVAECNVRHSIPGEIAASRAFFAARPRAYRNLQYLKDNLPPDLCYADPAGTVKLCGYDLIRPIGNSLEPGYFDGAAGWIQFLRNPDGSINPESLDTFVRVISWNAVDPVRNVVAARDYARFLNGRSTFAVAYERFGVEGGVLPELLLSANLVARQIDALPAVLKKDVPRLTVADVARGLRRNRRLRLTELVGDQDLFNQKFAECERLRSPEISPTDVAARWSTEVVAGMSHFSVLKDQRLWHHLGE